MSLRQLLTLKTEYHDLVTGQVKQQFLTTHHRLYETGDKAGKMLAWLSKREVQGRWVGRIVDTDGRVNRTDQHISSAFAAYYAEFYKARPLQTTHDIKNYLAQIQLPSLTRVEREGLEAEISLEEVQSAVQGLKTSRCPGPSRLPAELKRKYTDLR